MRVVPPPGFDSLSHFAAPACVFYSECTGEVGVADSSLDANRDGVVTQVDRGSPEGRTSRNEIVSILAKALLGMLVSGTGRMGGSPRKPLISGSQPALLGGEDGAEKPRTNGRR